MRLPDGDGRAPGDSKYGVNSCRGVLLVLYRSRFLWLFSYLLDLCVSQAAAELMLWRRWLSRSACVAELYPCPSWKVLGCCCSHATCVGWRFAFLLVRALGGMYFIGNGAGFRAVGTTTDRPTGWT